MLSYADKTTRMIEKNQFTNTIASASMIWSNAKWKVHSCWLNNRGLSGLKGNVTPLSSCSVQKVNLENPDELHMPGGHEREKRLFYARALVQCWKINKYTKSEGSPNKVCQHWECLCVHISQRPVGVSK